MQSIRISIAVFAVSVLAYGCALKKSTCQQLPATGGAACLAGNDINRCGERDLQNPPPALACYSPNPKAFTSLGPRSIDSVPTEFWDITLEEAVRYALQSSQVIRDLGGRVLAAPSTVQTRYNPGIEYTDPFFGVEAALSQFDANLTSQFSYANNDRVFNNLTLGGGAQVLQQDLTLMQSQLSKVAATGTQMNVRSSVGHDRNNRLNNLFGHVWESALEAEVRQPLLQGSGLNFNRIAGPNAAPGFRFSNGVVIAQMNNDISKIDFEVGIRDLVSDVVEAYWQLFRAYHEFQSRQQTRLAAEETWKAIQAKFDRGMEGGEADKEAQARAQFYFYQDLSIEALNGSETTVGVYEAERRLRLLLGMVVSDDRLLRPIDEVSEAKMIYDWDSLVPEAIDRRAEIRKQRWVIKQEELRLVAAKNFLLPRLDATALYRLRGFGDDLLGGGAQFASAGDNLASFDHQEWEFGLQLNVPIGRRRAYAGVRHAELRLCRERSVLQEQELQVSHELANAIGRDDQTHASMMASYERLNAAQDRLEATEASFEADKASLDLLLEAQERLGAAQTRYFSVTAAHAIAERNVQRSSGNLLGSFGITLQGDRSMVYCSRPAKRRDKIDYRFQVPSPSPAPRPAINQPMYETANSTGSIEVQPPTVQSMSTLPEIVDVGGLAEMERMLAPEPVAGIGL